MKNTQTAPVNGLQLLVTEVLFVPNMTEKSLVYVERVRPHDIISRENKMQRNEDSVLQRLREEFVAVFLNLIAELRSLAARCCGEVFAG
jgi:hypothetical protein